MVRRNPGAPFLELTIFRQVSYLIYLDPCREHLEESAVVSRPIDTDALSASEQIEHQRILAATTVTIDQVGSDYELDDNAFWLLAELGPCTATYRHLARKVRA